ncbi:glycosyltransferase family 4 protein [Neobacillus sp. 19]|uniref:glycosyltransferase family 4 protein n=1 Tax=Neobacillus sp. 19 TaxID=3394458 RepID=UPI003BF6B503
MKVLQINSVCGVGSTGRITTDIDKLLKDQGHESYIAYGRGSAINCDTAIRIGNDIDNYLHVAKTRVFDEHGLGSVKATEDFIKKIEEVNPDVIHLHNIHGYYINIEILFDYLKSAIKPVVWTLHDCWAFTGHCAYFDYANCNKWETGCHNCPQKQSYPASLFIDNSKSNYKRKKEIFSEVKNMTIITPSKWLSSLVEKSFLKEYPVKLINNGIDLSIFKPTESRIKERYNLTDKFIILGVASTWDRRKGLNYFIDLASQLNEDTYRIVLVGISDKQKKILPSNIVGITRTNDVQELAEIYTSANIFVNPTLEDNFPTTNLESLACGTPVVSFNTGGSPESINDTCGIVVEKGNIDELIKVIEEQRLNNKFNLSDCVNRSKLFDKNARYREYINVYKGT